MDNYKLISPEHLNHYGFLFGGNLMKWTDEYAYIKARMEFPNCRFVTVGMDKVEFKKGVSKGDILHFVVHQSRKGTSSVTYGVDVFRAEEKNRDREALFSTSVTFVRVDENGQKLALP